MFQDLVHTFRHRTDVDGFCIATLFADALATQVSVLYFPRNRMDITGLPGELPPYLSFSDGEVYLDRERINPIVDTEERAFYLLYRTWDPRVLSDAGLKDRKPERATQGRHDGTYYLHKVLGNADQASFREEWQLPGEAEVSFVSSEGRLRELTAWDFSSYPRRLSLLFSYRDELQIRPALIYA